MLQQRRSRVYVAITLVAALVLTMPIQAFATIHEVPDADPVATTFSNPYIYEPEVFWRRGWGNDVMPNFNLAIPPYADETTATPVEFPALGFIYKIDRTPSADFADHTGSFIDTNTPELYDYAWESKWTDPYAGTWLSHTFDMNGILFSDPVGLGATHPGARIPVEGVWWLHYNFFNEFVMSNTTLNIPFGIDQTPPLPVSKLSAVPYVGYAGPAAAWQPNSRVVVAWEDKEYDALAGAAAYQVWLNDTLLVDDQDPETPEYVYHIGPAYTSFTIENLPPGKNKIAVKVVDRATNVGPAVATYYYSDPDVPKIAITSPVDNGLVPRNAVFTANATDGGGIQFVQFYIDGVLVGSDTTAPYSLSKDMAAYANGTHTLLVKTKDMYGREVTDSANFTLDKTPPSVSSITDSPDPFFPVITDAYKDFSYVNFWVSEKVSAYLYVYTASGNLFAARSAPRGPGWTGLTWDGKGYGGQTGIGTFSYRIMAQDPAGNQTWSGLYSTTIRDYELVRVAPNAVRVVPR